MPAAETDLPIRMTPEAVRRRSFARVRRGFDPDQVRDYLHEVADRMKALEGQVREARMEADEAIRSDAVQQPDAYGELSSRLVEVLRAADQQAERLVRDANEEGSRVLAEARAEADRLRQEARSEAAGARSARDRAQREALAEADRELSELATRGDTLVEELQEMQESLLGAATELDSAIETSDPTMDEPKQPAKPSLDRGFEELWTTGRGIDLDLPNLPPLDPVSKKADRPRGSAD